MLSEISTFDPPAGVVLPPLPPRLEPEEPVVEIGWSVPRNRERLTAGGTSFLLHLLLILLLAFFFSIPVDKTSSQVDLVLTVPNVIGEEMTEIGDATIQSSAQGGSRPLELVGIPVEVQVQSQRPVSWKNEPLQLPQAEAQTSVTDLVPNHDWLLPSGVATGGGIEGRRAGMKGSLLASRGGSRQSEEAVARGLRWLAAHQKSDGSWSFDHRDGPCNGHCRNPGKPGDETSSTGATALALLPFYGAGETHTQGEYQEVMKRGLFYLGNKMVLTEDGGGDFGGSLGRMYDQGLTAIVFCEAYAMTHDEELKKFAQAGIDFILAAQHVGGGWRYMPGQPGDTTVTGWQLMALKSGKLAGLEVPSSAIYQVTHFLDSVSRKHKGSAYGYQNDQARRTTTAVGLYCRMLTGWNQFHPSLGRGVEILARAGPSPTDMYFNYYATMVLNHFNGPSWPDWNRKLRERLIAEQATRGHERGSWYYEHEHSAIGGRLYNTCMALMTLEVYYRYMPLYGLANGEKFE